MRSSPEPVYMMVVTSHLHKGTANSAGVGQTDVWMCSLSSSWLIISHEVSASRPIHTPVLVTPSQQGDQRGIEGGRVVWHDSAGVGGVTTSFPWFQPPHWLLIVWSSHGSSCVSVGFRPHPKGTVQVPGLMTTYCMKPVGGKLLYSCYFLHCSIC